MKCPRNILAILLLAVMLLPSMSVQAQPNDRSRQFPARSVGLAGLGRSFASGPNAILLNPAALGATAQYLLGAGYTYSGGDAPIHAFSASWTDSTPNPFHLAMGVMYDYVDMKDGSVQNVHGAAAYMLGLPALTLSVGVGAHYLGGIGEASAATTGDAGLVLTFAQALFLGAAGYNLVSTDDSAPRGVGGGLSFWGGPFMVGFDVSADFDVPKLDASGTKEDVITYYGGVQFQMIPEACFRAGVQYDGTHEATRVGGGLQFVLGQAIGVEFGYLQNVSEGSDMRIGVNLDLYNPFGPPQQ